MFSRGLLAVQLGVVLLSGDGDASPTNSVRALGSAPPQPQSSCKYLPGDAQWPTTQTWASLNHTVGGRLIATVPQASVCHHTPYERYDEAECRELQGSWDLAQTYILKPAEIMNPFFQSQSCDPWTPANQTCSLGNYASYSINVTGADDVRAGLEFAREQNVRLVIRNTGHDYTGKSTGKGALSLWMRNMKDIEIIMDYKSSGYNGPAAKAGPGAIGGEIYEALHAEGYLAVGGDCPSVGWGGGYTQGGGHSLLNSVYGMAADQVLEWEVITPQGEHLVATPTQNSDLYWALSGGGGGTFGVVLSMTSKIYSENQTVGGGTLRFNNSAVGNETYWKAVGALFSHLPTYVDGGNSFDFEVAATEVIANSITMLGGNASTVEAMVAPFLTDLDDLGIAYDFQPSTSASYYDHFSRDFGPLPFGTYPGTTLFSSRLIPRKTIETEAGRTKLTDAMAATLNDEFYLGCHALNVQNQSHPDNAVNPAWRQSITICIYLGLWDWQAPFEKNLANRQHLVEYVLPTMEAATPGGGVYLNEVDSGYQGDWREEFYGSNYERLLRVKDKYDPEHALWGWTAIGSDYWALDEDSRLCPA